MKKLLLFLPLLCMAVEYEFLTPQLAVIKSSEPFKVTSAQVSKIGIWQKENALLRSAKDKILPKADITFFTYLVFRKPLENMEKITVGGCELQYDRAVPTPIFKLNQVGNGVKQQKKYAYIGAWLGSAGALALGKFDGREFEVRKSSNDQCVFRNKLKLRCKMVQAICLMVRH